MSEADKDYFQRRAEEELSLAQASDDERLIHFHYQLAGLYLDLVFGSSAPERMLAELNSQS